jgi:aspartate aminotransferase
MIPADLATLVAPLHAFEAIRRRALRFGPRLCDLSYANPYTRVADETRAVLRAALDGERVLDLQYTPFGGSTLARRAVADALTQSHGMEFDFRDVILTPGAMGALHLALREAASPGDEVIVLTPCWLDYPTYARFQGLHPRFARLAPPNFDLDLDSLSSTLTSRTAAVILCHPCNPTGRCYSAQDLAGLASVLKDAEARFGRTIALIADESHRDFIPRGRFTPIACAWPTTLEVYSFGKYHFLQGQRIGYVAASPRHPRRQEVRESLCDWARITGLCTPTALMQKALPALLALVHDLRELDEARTFMREALATERYTVVPADGTLFLYVAVPDSRPAMEFVRVLAESGVLVLPSEVFHHDLYFRVALTGSRPMLERALPVFTKMSS